MQKVGEGRKESDACMYVMYEVMQIFSTTVIGADVKETLRGLSREYKRVHNITGDHMTSSDLRYMTGN